MIISESRRFIFIHIKKNAGTSIANALYPFSANRLVLALEHVVLRMGYHIPFGSKRFGGHITAREIVDKIGRTSFDQYFSFAVVRNPWDWQASLYNYILKKPHHPLNDRVRQRGSFSEYIKWHCENIKNDNLPDGSGSVCQSDYLYSQDGELLVDYIAKFEDLDFHFDEICSRIGVKAKLPRLNVHKTRHYRDYYSGESRQLVEECFEVDIRRFDYEF